jgi:Tol biopolymer transport system component
VLAKPPSPPQARLHSRPDTQCLVAHCEPGYPGSRPFAPGEQLARCARFVAAVRGRPFASSDGNQVVFVRKKATPNVFPDETIWVMNVDGSNQHEVFAPPAPNSSVTRDRDPTWSPDGTQIAFVRDSISIAAGIVAMNAADGTGLVVLVPSTTNQVDRVSDLAWSPDGNEIAYSFDFVCCLSHIDVAKVDGSDTRILIGPRNAVDIQTFEFGAAWSPDGTQIAFHGQPNVNNLVGTAGVWVTNSTGLPNPAQLAQGGLRPSWSPKGDRIAFERAGSVWTMNADGSNQVMLTAGGMPSWGP